MTTTKKPKKKPGRPRNGSKTGRQNDVNRLKLLTRKLLSTMNKAMENKTAPKFASTDEWKQVHALVFGKAAFSDSLVTLSDLLLKLNDVDIGEEGGDAAILAAPDVALLETFLRKMAEHSSAPEAKKPPGE